MVKYKIEFDLDIEKVLDYDSDDQYVDIKEIDDYNFYKLFDGENKIKEFENWYNEDVSEDDKIEINSIDYNCNEYGECYIDVELENALKNENEFADKLLEYMFQVEDYPTVFYHVTGKEYEDYWDGYSETPRQRIINVDYDDSAYVDSYCGLTINKI